MCVNMCVHVFGNKAERDGAGGWGGERGRKREGGGLYFAHH